MSTTGPGAARRDVLIVIVVATAMVLQLAAFIAIGLGSIIVPSLLAGREFAPAVLEPAVSLTLADATPRADIEALRAALLDDPRVIDVVELEPEDNLHLLQERVPKTAEDKLTYAPRSLKVVVATDAIADSVHREIINKRIPEASGTVEAVTFDPAVKLSLWERFMMGPM